MAPQAQVLDRDRRTRQVEAANRLTRHMFAGRDGQTNLAVHDLEGSMLIAEGVSDQRSVSDEFGHAEIRVDGYPQRWLWQALNDDDALAIVRENESLGEICIPWKVDRDVGSSIGGPT
jgi:hypothetical protein